MKTLSLTQPWASLVAVGAKKLETRSWSTSYRGQLAIHAAKGFPGWAEMTCYQEPFRTTLRDSGAAGDPPLVANLPRGVIIAVCNLVDVKRITATNAPAEPERSFGDYAPGRYMWFLEDAQMLVEPVPIKGALGLWEWDGGEIEVPQLNPQARLF